jgi:MtN3 and saliva related transmembrane protein
MIKPELLGYMAAVVTTASFAPQAYLVWKTRNVNGVSLGMYTIISVGLSLWLAYGFMIDSWPVIIANAATLSLSLFILAMKLRWGIFNTAVPAVENRLGAE